MVMYRLGPTVAHVMLHKGSCWQSFCGRVVIAARQAAQPGQLGAASMDAQPSRPWCRECVKATAALVDELTDTVVLFASSGRLT